MVPVKLAGDVNTKPVAALPLTPMPLKVPPAGVPRKANDWPVLLHSVVSAPAVTVGTTVTRRVSTVVHRPVFTTV